MADELTSQLLVRWLKDAGSTHVVIHTDISTASVIIANLQLALRHPGNNRPSSQLVERFTRELIKLIDPECGEFYQFFMRGFDPNFDL